MERYDSNISRRRLLRYLGLGLGAGALAGGTWYLRKGLLGSGAQTINFTAPSSYNLEDADWKHLVHGTGLNVHFVDNGNDVGPVLARMTTGTMAQDFDVQGLQGGAEADLVKAGTLLPWDVAKIPNWAHVWDKVKQIPYTQVGGQRYSIPIALNADSIIYLPDLVSTVTGYESGVVDSYAAVFDPRFAGRTSMEDAWINSALFTAMYLKGHGASIADPGNLTSDELKQVMTFLIDKKRAGQFRKFWSGWEQGVQLMKSGEVVLMTGWEPIVKALQTAGINARYAVPAEGYEGWTNTLLLQVGAQSRGRVLAAHQFANELLDGYYGCALLKLRGYVVPSDTTVDFARSSGLFDPKVTADSVAYVQKKLDSKVYWQNVRPAEYRLYDEWWDKLRNA